MSLPFVDADALATALPIEAAIDAIETAWRAGLPSSPDRMHVETGTGDVLLMPSHSGEAVGVKLVTVAPRNPSLGLPLISGIYVLFHPETLVPVMLVDAAALTGLRTAAVSGVATRLLAPIEIEHLVIFGAGSQARAHVAAMRAVRDIGRVTIVGRSSERASALAAETGSKVGDPSAVSTAQLICCCTTSESPLFDGSLVREGTHLNAVGSYKPDRRELDGTLMGRTSVVVVEDRALARAEAGDVVLAIGEGKLDEANVVELGELLKAPRRRQPGEISVFKSVGMASEDLVIVAALHRALTA